jgi:RNA polymerase sigma-70 factor, ECF subfamily
MQLVGAEARQLWHPDPLDSRLSPQAVRPDPIDDLTTLAYAAGRGDHDAFASLIRATQHEVMRFLAALTEPGEVEDLTQETFLRAYTALPRFVGRSSLRTWLFAIARRVAADQIRYVTRRPRLADFPAWQDKAEAADPHGRPRFDELHALTELVHGLADDRREAFVLTQIAGLSYAEAAEVCDCPIGTIRSRLARARSDLMTAMHDTATA